MEVHDITLSQLSRAHVKTGRRTQRIKQNFSSEITKPVPNLLSFCQIILGSSRVRSWFRKYLFRTYVVKKYMYLSTTYIKFLALSQGALAGTLWSRNGVRQNVTWLRMRTPWCHSTSGVSMPATSSLSSNEPARLLASGPPLTGRLASQSAATTGRACHLWPSSARQGQTARSKEGNLNANLWSSLEGPRGCGTYLGKAEMLKVVCFSVFKYIQAYCCEW